MCKSKFPSVTLYVSFKCVNRNFLRASFESLSLISYFVHETKFNFVSECHALCVIKICKSKISIRNFFGASFGSLSLISYFVPDTKFNFVSECHVFYVLLEYASAFLSRFAQRATFQVSSRCHFLCVTEVCGRICFALREKAWIRIRFRVSRFMCYSKA